MNPGGGLRLRILVPAGTRPEFVKLAPVVHALRRRHDVHVVVTGQHHDPNLTDVFFRELGLVVDHRAELPAEPLRMLGALQELAVQRIAEVQPDLVLLLGDTNTVPTFALAARHATVPVVHLEAGLRSHNPTSAEEVNRRVAGALAQLHLAPTSHARANLLAEGVDPERVLVVGNPVLDAVAGTGVPRVEPGERRGALVTAHRATNVDDPERLRRIVRIVHDLAARTGSVLLPLHPRTRARLAASGLSAELDGAGITVTDPLPYGEMLRAIARSRVVVTDSGGLQEEAAWFGVPVVVLRSSTPRPEGVEAGFATLTDVDPARAAAAVEHALRPEVQRRILGLPCPYGDGTTAAQVAELLDRPSVRSLLTITPPELGRAVA